MKTEPNESIQPLIMRQIGENEYRIAGMHDQMHDRGFLKSTSGLSKREHFASMAMQGFLSQSREDMPPNTATIEYYVNASVKSADLLVEALNRTES